MNTDNIFLRQNTFPPLTNKMAVLDSDDFDNNFINVYKDIQALKVTDQVDDYGAATVYDDALNQFAKYNGRLWQWVNGSPGSGQTPADGIYWQEIFPTMLVHRKNSDDMLAEGSTDEVTAAEIRAYIDGGLTTTTNLSLSAQTATSFQLDSSTGADVVILEATQVLAGLLGAADKAKLDSTSGSNTGDQTLVGLNGEDVSNKVVDFSTLNDTLYPTTNAVATYVQSITNTKLDSTLIANTNLQLAGYDLDFIGGNVVINSAYTLPNADGSAGYFLKTNGAGVLSWDSVPADKHIGSDDLTIDTAGTRKLIMGGALATDIFAIRNSTDTQNIFEVQGAGLVKFENGAAQIDGSAVLFGQSGANNFIQLDGSNNRIYSLNNAFKVTIGSQVVTIDSTSTDIHFYQGTTQLGNTLQATSGATNSILIENGTPPPVNKTNRHWYYSADIVAGNSAPHFRTENGDILKLYKNTALTAPDGTLANAVIRQAEIETILQNLGIL